MKPRRDTVGTAKLTTVGAPTPLVSETQVKRADAPRVLEFTWGGQNIRWELEPRGGGWQRLNTEYAKQFGVETPGSPGERI